MAKQSKHTHSVPHWMSNKSKQEQAHSETAQIYYSKQQNFNRLNMKKQKTITDYIHIYDFWSVIKYREKI